MNNTKINRNPYIIGRPITEPKLFFGRENLFHFIDDNLNNSQKVILLHGQRRIGKSSVLSQIPNFVNRENFVFVPFDLQDQSQLSLSAILHRLATKIIDCFNLSPDQVTLPLATELEKDLTIFSRHFLPKVYQAVNGKNLVLLLDEFDVLSNDVPNLANQHFFPHLKSILQEQKKLFVIPVVGRELEDMPKLLDLFKGAPKQKIGLLDESSAKQLITEPAEGMLKYDPNAIQAILELSAGHPYFTQIICFAIFGQARGEQRWQVTRTDVENIVDKAIEIGEAGLVWFRQGLPIPERVIFSTVATKPEVKEPLKLLEEYGVVHTPELDRAQKLLVEWGFLQKVNSPQLLNVVVSSYRVTVELVRRWMLNQHSLKEEIYELEKLNPEAHNSYLEASKLHEQRHIEAAIQLYEKVLQINPNHFSTLLGLVQGYLDLDTKEFQKALELSERAYKFNPEDTKEGFIQLLLNYGNELMRQKQFQLAEQQFNKVLELDRNHKLAKDILAKAKNEIRKSSTNPYFIGSIVPLEQFVGRKEEFDKAWDIIMNGSRMFFYGSAGTGKSSFLKYLAAPETWQDRGINLEHGQYLIVEINCQDIRPFQPSAFWRELLIRLKDVLSDLHTKLPEQDQSDTSVNLRLIQSEIENILQKTTVDKADVKQILKEIKRQDKFLVLLLDEYDAVLHPNDNYAESAIQQFLSECRILQEQDANRCLSTIMILSQSPIGLSSTSKYNNLPDISSPLKPFKDNELKILWEHMPTPWDQKQSLQRIVKEITGGHPALFQMLCYLLYNQLKQKGIPDIETLKADFENMTEELLFRRIWVSLNETQRMVMRLICLYSLEGKIDKKHYDMKGVEDYLKNNYAILNNLKVSGFIQSNRERNKESYSFTASAMQQWVIREIVSNNEGEIKERERVFGIMNQGQINKITQPIKWIRENPDVIKSVAGGFQELAKVFLPSL
ncbi:AAA family ATPase [Iningainema tapete]|uniref:AAA family ATPase n=1 Tax=Iningainema tapete BLCC-T55 TaxID=2748662 RepID=A0A8J7CBN6_9CYAN|nr:AAA family ATPase [Iningainema tapete]MBD2778561.1 AAA family ATPase [Iningainema tapete BLCC-T55]